MPHWHFVIWQAEDSAGNLFDNGYSIFRRVRVHDSVKLEPGILELVKKQGSESPIHELEIHRPTRVGGTRTREEHRKDSFRAIGRGRLFQRQILVDLDAHKRQVDSSPKNFILNPSPGTFLYIND
jgi:hypothetical protein